jgi:hypothetical protein
MCGEVLSTYADISSYSFRTEVQIKSLLQPWLLFKHLENRISYDAGAGSIFT